jgi:hypothetical protein
VNFDTKLSKLAAVYFFSVQAFRKAKTTMGDELPVPAQLETQLGKCKTVRSSDYYKPRTKTAEVRRDDDGCAVGMALDVEYETLTMPLLYF